MKRIFTLMLALLMLTLPALAEETAAPPQEGDRPAMGERDAGQRPADGERPDFGEQGGPGGRGGNGGMAGSEHLTSFNYAYRLETVRDWLFAQSK